MTDNKISPFGGGGDGDIEMPRRNAPNTDPAQVDSSRQNLLAKAPADLASRKGSLLAPSENSLNISSNMGAAFK